MDINLRVGESKTIRAVATVSGNPAPLPGYVSWTHWAPPGVFEQRVNPDQSLTITGLAEGSAGCSAAIYQWPTGWIHWHGFNVIVGNPAARLEVLDPSAAPAVVPNSYAPIMSPG